MMISVVKGNVVVNRDLNGAAGTRLSEVLFGKPDRSFGGIAPLPSNVDAIDAALLFSAGMTSLVAIVGPSGWGKTHLMQAVASRLTQEQRTTIEPLSPDSYLAAPMRVDPHAPLVIDDVQGVLSKSRQGLALRSALERRVRANRPTILAFTMARPTRQLRAFLPNARDWMIATIVEPAPAERVLLLSQMAISEGLALSPRLVQILAVQMHGNGNTFAGAIHRLRLSGADWMEPSRVLRALGMLEPFFADNSGWDLKRKILRLAERHRAQFAKVNPTDLAIYVMLREAGLAEAAVARSVDLRNSDVYQRAMRFQTQLDACDVTRMNLRQFVEIVVGSLTKA